MVIDNSNFAVKNKLKRMTLVVGIAAIIATVALLPELDKWLSFPRYVLSVVVFVLAASYSTYSFFRRYNFVHFSTDLGKISVRYYHLVTMFKKYKIFEFPLDELLKYEEVKKGLKHEIILYRREGNKITKYPAVSVTGLTKDEVSKIIGSLQMILNK